MVTCKGPLPYSSISGGSVLYTQEPKFLMFISGASFSTDPCEILQKSGDSELKNGKILQDCHSESH